MYPSVTSDKTILQASRTLLQEQGWTALNIRSVAAACGVSVGSIYNRFGSKSQLVAATVESIWQEIFCLPQEPGAFADLLSCVAWLFQRLEESRQTYPGFLSVHALCFSQEELDAGQRRMERAGPGPPGAPRDISRGVFRRGLCRPAVLPAAGRPAAERRALRPHPCPDPQNHLLKNSHKIVGIFQTPT